MINGKEIQVKEPAITFMSIDELKRLTAFVNDVKKALMKEGKDYVIDYRGDQYTARSGFAKLAQGFNLSDEIPIIKTLYNIDIEGVEEKEYTFTHKLGKEWKTRTFKTRIHSIMATVKVINLESGRFASGEGACSVDELDWTNNLDPKWYHRCLGTAKTRAWNRAVSNYIGSADVSAEEMGYGYEDEPPQDENPERVQVKSTTKAVKEPKKPMVKDMLNKTRIYTPEWDIRDELNRTPESWGNGVDIGYNWIKQAGLVPEQWDISCDTVKLQIKPKKELTVEYMGEVNKLFTDHGFIQSRGSSWRLNKKDVVD